VVGRIGVHVLEPAVVERGLEHARIPCLTMAAPIVLERVKALVIRMHVPCVPRAPSPSSRTIVEVEVEVEVEVAAAAQVVVVVVVVVEVAAEAEAPVAASAAVSAAAQAEASAAVSAILANTTMATRTTKKRMVAVIAMIVHRRPMKNHTVYHVSRTPINLMKIKPRVFLVRDTPPRHKGLLRDPHACATMVMSWWMTIAWR